MLYVCCTLNLVPQVLEDRARHEQRGDAAMPPRTAPQHEGRRGGVRLQPVVDDRQDVANDSSQRQHWERWGERNIVERRRSMASTMESIIGIARLYT